MFELLFMGMMWISVWIITNTELRLWITLSCLKNLKVNCPRNSVAASRGAWGGIPPPPPEAFPPLALPLEEKMAKISHFRQILGIFAPSEFILHSSMPPKKFWCRHWRNSKMTLKYIWGHAVFKLWIKTVKITFRSITQEPLDLFKF